MSNVRSDTGHGHPHEEMTVYYWMQMDGGRGGDDLVEADTLEEAMELAREWADGAEWPDGKESDGTHLVDVGEYHLADGAEWPPDGEPGWPDGQPGETLDSFMV
jgi:hypothetical protein